MELTFDIDEVGKALRALHPEIPNGSSVRVTWVSGPGPGGIKRSAGAALTHPVVTVTFNLPEEKTKP